jgi:hypothetical protein
MKTTTNILDQSDEVLAFLKTRFPLYHQSNVFFRDIQYGIRAYLEKNGKKVGYTVAEEIAHAYTRKLEKDGIFHAVDHQSWVVDFPKFKTPSVKPAASPKPAGPAPAAERLAPPPRPAALPSQAAPSPATTPPATPAVAKSISDAPTMIAFPGTTGIGPNAPPGGSSEKPEEKKGE